MKGLALLCVFGVLPCVAQHGISDPRVQAALSQVQTSDWSQRSSAFYEIVRIGLDTDKAVTSQLLMEFWRSVAQARPRELGWCKRSQNC